MLNPSPTTYPTPAPLLFLVREPLDWQEAHRELARLANTRAALDWEEGSWLLRGLRSRVDRHLGFGSFPEYVERLFGYKPRWTAERLRVAEALEQLPQMTQALRDGEVTWSAVRELTRVATGENEHQWLAVARGKTLRQIEAQVSGRIMGDSPTDPADPSRVRHVLRFEVTAETLCTFREAMVKLRRDAGERIEDDDALLLLARQVLGGPTDPGRASYQVQVTLCEQCGRGWQHGGGELSEMASHMIEKVACDAQRVEQTPPANTDARISAGPTGAGPVRAYQDVPPSVRRAVLARDHGQCTVPGCTHASFLDVHHILPRSEGGAHHSDQLVTICGAHHRAIHHGELRIEGGVATNVTHWHADGTLYGASVANLDPSSIEASAEAFRALRSLGFRETETRRALTGLSIDAHVGAGVVQREARVVQLIRAALARLSPAQRH